MAGYSNPDTSSGTILQPKYPIAKEALYLRCTLLHVYIVNAKILHIAQAIHYIAHALKTTRAEFLSQLYRDATFEDFPNLSLGADVASLWQYYPAGQLSAEDFAKGLDALTIEVEAVAP